MNKALREAFEAGESSGYADWSFALNEFGGFPDDFDYGPVNVAKAVAALRQDAARYRWLRERFIDETYGPGCFSEIFDCWPGQEEPPETLDAAIDAELAKEGKA